MCGIDMHHSLSEIFKRYKPGQKDRETAYNAQCTQHQQQYSSTPITKLR